jgi:hypothetical protein
LIRRLQILAAALAAAAIASLSIPGAPVSQPDNRPLRLGIFTPSIEFADSAAAVKRAIGRDVEGLSFTGLGSLRGAGVDVAIVDAECAVSNRWPVLASARVGGAAGRSWALFARDAKSLLELRGKRLVTVKSGCNDAGFVANALLESEVPMSFFGAWTGKPEVKGAVAEVATLRGGEAVFAPVGSGRGLRQLFVAASIPGPALVKINGGLDGETAAAVARAVAAFGGRGPISGFAAGGAGAYAVLGRRMAGSTKRGVFATPPPVRFKPPRGGLDIIAEPARPAATELAPVDDLFEAPADRM